MKNESLTHQKRNEGLFFSCDPILNWEKASILEFFCIFNSKRKKPLRVVNKFHFGRKVDLF